MNFIKSNGTATISELRARFYQKLTAPIDAMWEQLYIAASQHYLIAKDNKRQGYCCINDQACLLQLFLIEKSISQMDHVITSLIESKLINSASLSSNEPVSFNSCLNNSTSIRANTFCFQHSNTFFDLKPAIAVEEVSTNDIPAIKKFLKEQIGMNDNFGYTENLVVRKEMFLLRESDEIIATSECRNSDTQPEIADLGIIVNRDYQGKGIATQIMQLQVNRVLNSNRKPICSTTSDNIASQKVIARSGFYCSNIIFDMTFS